MQPHPMVRPLWTRTPMKRDLRDDAIVAIRGLYREHGRGYDHAVAVKLIKLAARLLENRPLFERISNDD